MKSAKIAKDATNRLLFTPFRFDANASVTPSLTGLNTTRNRIVVAPMCQYSAEKGQATDWHQFHWTNMLNSGAGIFIIEATGVSPIGRITNQCLGLWDDATEFAIKDKLDRAKKNAPKDIKVFIQLAHSGRKASSSPPWKGGKLVECPSPTYTSTSFPISEMDLGAKAWTPWAPSALSLNPGERAPLEMTPEHIAKVKDDFVSSAKRAQRIGVDGVEIHSAHGYLLHEFLSPLSNIRKDKYGGSFENRIRFPLEVFSAVRDVFKGTLGMRISATDWIENGWTVDETAEMAVKLKALGCDYVHVSSGGLSSTQKIVVKPSYQVPFAKVVKQRSGLPTIAVGMITDPHQAEGILQSGDADFVALARAFLYKPRWGWEAASALEGTVESSPQYWRCLPSGSGPIFEDLVFGQR